MTDVNPDFLAALGSLMSAGQSTPAEPPTPVEEPDDDFTQRLERAERIANGLDA